MNADFKQTKDVANSNKNELGIKLNKAPVSRKKLLGRLWGLREPENSQLHSRIATTINDMEST